VARIILISLLLAVSICQSQAQNGSYVATNTQLTSSTISSYPNGVWRNDYSVGVGAPPLFFAHAWGGVATFSSQHSPNDTITINNVAITFVNTAPSGNQVQISNIDFSHTLQNLLVFLINSTNANFVSMTYITSGSSLNIQSRVPGSAYSLAKSSSAIALSGSSLVAGVGNCTVTNMGSQFSASGGGCWQAIFPSGMIDIRWFGAIPDNLTAVDSNIANASAYANSIGGCVYVPSVYPGFKLLDTYTVGGSGSACLIGDRIKNQPGLPFGNYADLNFPNDTDGITINANNGWYVGRLSIKGHAATSTSVTHTQGLHLLNVAQGEVDVSCRAVTAAEKAISRNRVSLVRT
jgi:hypothetical protein